MGRLRVLSKNGDDEIAWADAESAAIAKEAFDKLVGRQHHLAFKKTGPGTHEQMKAFDQNAEEILLMKRLVGG